LGKFRESALAHRYLDGLTGLEIGGAAHNPFGLKTRNVDYSADMGTSFKQHEINLCGEAMRVDIVALGNRLPLRDKSEDFVVSSHVIEHFFDPVGTLKEWARVARRYIYVICPLRNALPSDQDLPITPLQELLDRHAGKIPMPCAKEWEYPWHHTRWTPEGFVDMCRHIGFNVVDSQDADDKVGNGFAVVIKLD
jgi:ubiquinone/menaquinone biosynthesis C-methylase UbiE